MSDPAVILAARLAQLWQASRPTIMERMAVLHASATTLATDPGDEPARTAAREAAHKLAGVLGVFGMPRGSEVASALEQRLDPGGPLTPEDLAALHSGIAELDAILAAKG